MLSGNMLSRKLLKTYKYPIFILQIPVLIVMVRYHDVRGSFFPESYEFRKASGVIEESSGSYASKGVGFNVTYSYEVFGKRYISNRVGFSWKAQGIKKKLRPC